MGIDRKKERKKEKRKKERKNERMKENKVIRPKSRASALSKNVRQTDGQTIFFQKQFLKGFLLLQVSSLPFRAIKNAIKSLKNDFVTDRRTDRPTNGPTDKVAYRVA